MHGWLASQTPNHLGFVCFTSASSSLFCTFTSTSPPQLQFAPKHNNPVCSCLAWCKEKLPLEVDGHWLPANWYLQDLEEPSMVGAHIRRYMLSPPLFSFRIPKLRLFFLHWFLLFLRRAFFLLTSFPPPSVCFLVICFSFHFTFSFIHVCFSQTMFSPV